ncbi:hypothetical protein SAMN06269185_0441 [Natronoarchaeum philippinense]|uniref:SCP-2 sterol transfer family protein n=1 Tax=Natronoarchaeum philippinense TaxID=558529 RepID=A0A285N3R3_NATPI|nr:hypothetical protein SAMN06269185_0441 [Natronoarchaeum philippinense]
MIHVSTTEFASHGWWERYKETVNDDPEMQVRGHDKFDTNFYVDIGDERFLIEMNDGHVDDVVPDPALNNRWEFGVEGDRETWEEFVAETPPAFNHEIIASNYRAAVRNEDNRLELTGDNKKIFQNLRAFQRALDLMREANVNGGGS